MAQNFDMSGLAALAGTRVGNLNLAVPRITTADTSAGQFLSGIAGGMNNLSQILQQNKAMDLQKQAMAENIKNAAASRDAQAQTQQLNQQKLEMGKKVFQAKLDAAAMESARTEKEDKLQALKTAGFAIAQTTPQDWNDHKVKIISGLVQSGILDEQTGKDVSTMEYNDIIRQAKAISAVSGKAMDFQKAGINLGGEQTSTLTPASKTAAQKAITDADETLVALDQIQKSYQKDFLGGGGAIKGGALAASDWLSTVPGVGSMFELNPENKGWLEKRANFAAQSQGLALSYIKQLSGVQYSDKQLDFMKQILPMPGDSPTVFEGKMKGLKQHLSQLKNLKEELLASGIKYSTDPNSEYAQQYLARAQGTLYKSAKIATEDGIQSTLKQNPNMTRDELVKTLKTNGYSIAGEK